MHQLPNEAVHLWLNTLLPNPAPSFLTFLLFGGLAVVISFLYSGLHTPISPHTITSSCLLLGIGMQDIDPAKSSSKRLFSKLTFQSPFSISSLTLECSSKPTELLGTGLLFKGHSKTHLFLKS